MEFCEGAKVTDQGYFEKHSIDGKEVRSDHVYTIGMTNHTPCPTHPGDAEVGTAVQ